LISFFLLLLSQFISDIYFSKKISLPSLWIPLNRSQFAFGATLRGLYSSCTHRCNNALKAILGSFDRIRISFRCRSYRILIRYVSDCQPLFQQFKIYSRGRLQILIRKYPFRYLIPDHERESYFFGVGDAQIISPQLRYCFCPRSRGLQKVSISISTRAFQNLSLRHILFCHHCASQQSQCNNS
jgi:hypothetical protein